MATRRERVVLELEDRFTAPMARAAAATELLNRRLDSLSNEAVHSSKVTRSVGGDIDGMGKSAKSAERDIDKLSGRLRILADVGAVIGPSFVPIGAVAVPAVTGLASMLGFAAVGAGTAVLAFQGMGDALKAVNKAALEPTTENLEAAQQAMAQISPDAQAFVTQLRSMYPELERLRNTAAAGLLPGLSEGLEGLLQAGPRVERIIHAISTELGEIAGDTGQSLGSDRWAGFLDFIADEGPDALSDFAAAAGNTTHALAELWMATNPLNEGFSNWLVEVTADFDRWAQGLSSTDGFQEFIDYIETNGPQVAETLGAVGNAVLQIVEAVAPLGGPSLRIIEAFADAIATIADSSLGTPLLAVVSALGAANTGLRVMNALNVRTFGGPAAARLGTYATGLFAVTTAQDRARLSAQQLAQAQGAQMGNWGKGAAAIGALSLAATSLGDNFDYANTATLALAGTATPLGPLGGAIGGLVGLTMDAANANKQWADSFQEVNDSVRSNDVGRMQAELDNLAARRREMDAKLEGFIGKGKGINLDDSGKANDIESARLRLGWQIQLQTALDGTTKSYQRNQAAVQANDAAMRMALEAATQTAEEFVGLGRDVDNAEVSLNDWITQLNQQATALLNFGENARRAADKGLRDGLIQQLKEAGPAGAMRLKQLANASEKEIARANRAFDRGRAALERFRADAKPKIEIDIEVAAALADIRRVQNALNALQSSQNASGLNNQGDRNRRRNEASGGPIYGPGTKTSDSIPAMLSNGEYVIQAAAVDRYGVGFFNAANQMRLAGGGHVDNTPDSVLANLYGSGGKSKSTAAAKAREAAASDAAARALAALKIIVDRSTKSIDKERAERDELRSRRADLANSVAGGFRTDIFDRSNANVWAPGGGLGDPFSILSSDISNANQFKATLQVLKGKGLSGDAFAALAQTGDLEQAQRFAQMSKEDIARYEYLYKQREKAATSVGAYAGNAVFGAQLQASQRQLVALVKVGNTLDRYLKLADQYPQRSAYYLSRAINGAAASARRRAK